MGLCEDNELQIGQKPNPVPRSFNFAAMTDLDKDLALLNWA